MFISFDVQLARFALRGVPASVVKWMAIDLIQRGYESPELDDLAWEPLGRDSAVKFAAAAKSIGLTIPSRAEAESILLRHHITRVTASEMETATGDSVPPAPADTEAADVVLDLGALLRDLGAPSNKDGCDLRALFTACQIYEQLTRAPDSDAVYQGLHGAAALTALRRDLREMGLAWLGKESTTFC